MTQAPDRSASTRSHATATALCAELLPEHIRLDDWGYPIVDGEPVAPELVALARRAAAACPTLALLLEARREPAR